ncbi:AAC(3) family N-acetyltransferase [Bacteroides sp.]
MNLSKLYSHLVTVSPYFEILVRNLYWHNVGLLKKFKSSVALTDTYVKDRPTCDFADILDYLSRHLSKGSLMIVHSSYDALGGTGLSPEEVVEKLVELAGETGTLAMPVIRKFKGEPKYEDILKTNTDDLVCTYNVNKTCVTSGFLPYALMKREGSITSRFPFNPMTATGPLAKDMMEHNLDGDCPSPHGPHSSWKFCLDHGAVIIGLGIDLAHHITMLHVGEEAFEWPVSEEKWYRRRKFRIIDGDYEIEKTVHERKPKWGMLHIAEKTLANDLRKSGILKERMIDGVNVTVLYAHELMDFLRVKRRKNPTYPYFLC